MVREHSSNASRRHRWSRLVRLLACSLTALSVSACTNPFSSEPTASEGGPVDGEPAVPATAIVEFVIDGDTVDLLIDGEEERVRLIGIDTPESVSRSTPVQCYGKEASEALTGLLPPGAAVRIERDAEARDRYGRLLLYVHRADDDLFVNRWMVEQGFADALFFEPNTTFENDFVGLRNDARAEGRGLWSACDGADQPLE